MLVACVQAEPKPSTLKHRFAILKAAAAAAHLSLPHDEEVDAVACGYKALRIQHQRLINARLVGL
jgi:hypothetical protein